MQKQQKKTAKTHRENQSQYVCRESSLGRYMCLGPKKGIHKFHGRHCTALLGSEHVLPAQLTSATIQETIFGCGWSPCFSDFSSEVRNANERSLIAVSAMENVRHVIRMRFARRSAVIHCLQHSEMILEGLSPDVFRFFGGVPNLTQKNTECWKTRVEM